MEEYYQGKLLISNRIAGFVHGDTIYVDGAYDDVEKKIIERYIKKQKLKYGIVKVERDPIEFLTKLIDINMNIISNTDV